MIIENAEKFSKLLQLTMLPTVLISAAGLILLSVTNRMGRTVDRSRSLALEIESSPDKPSKGVKAQLPILIRRTMILRWSVGFLALSILLSSLMIFTLIFYFFSDFNLEKLALSFFIGSVLCLIASMGSFLMDTKLALKALRVDLAPHLNN